MPWNCSACTATDLADDSPVCTGCGSGKSTWTIVKDRTRAFVVSGKKFTLQKGDSTSTYAVGDPQGALVSLSRAEQITVLPKAKVRELHERGHLPPSAHVVFVTLFHKRAKVLDVDLEVLYGGNPSEELSFPLEGGEDVEDPWYVKFLFVYGDGDLEDVSFPDIHLVDISEDTEHLCALSVEFQALRRPIKELPAEVERRALVWSDAPTHKRLPTLAWSDAPLVKVVAPAPQPEPAPGAEPEPAPGAEPEPGELNDYVLAVVAEYEAAHHRQGYYWPSSGSWQGNINDTYYDGRLCSSGDGQGRSYCCGITWEVFLEATRRYYADRGEPHKLPGIEHGELWSKIRSAWFVGGDTSAPSRGAPMAIQNAGIGRVVSHAEAKPGDFAQIFNDDQRAAGHAIIITQAFVGGAFQTWSSEGCPPEAPSEGCQYTSRQLSSYHIVEVGRVSLE